MLVTIQYVFANLIMNLVRDLKYQVSRRSCVATVTAKFFFLKGETGNAKKCNDIIKKMSELVKKSKGGF